MLGPGRKRRQQQIDPGLLLSLLQGSEGAISVARNLPWGPGTRVKASSAWRWRLSLCLFRIADLGFRISMRIHNPKSAIPKSIRFPNAPRSLLHLFGLPVITVQPLAMEHSPVAAILHL